MKYLLFCFAICLLILGSCGEDRQITVTQSAEGADGILLPDAGASWYMVELPCQYHCDSACIHHRKFLAKHVEVLKGTVTVDIPSLSESDTIRLLTKAQSAQATWGASWNVINQDLFSISLVDAKIQINVDTSLVLLLRTVSDRTVDQLMESEEVAMVQNLDFQKKCGFSRMMKEFQQAGAHDLLSPPNVVGWLPLICANDGPSLKRIARDTSAYFVGGVTNGKEALAAWITLDYDPGTGKRSSVFHARKYTISGDSTLETISAPMPPGTQHFRLGKWISRTIFTKFWQDKHPGEPLPGVMPADAGLFTWSGASFGSFGSDIMTGVFPDNMITIQSDGLRETNLMLVAVLGE